MMTERQLRTFTGSGYDKGRPLPIQMLWIVTATLLVERIWCSPKLRVAVLRLFGARIGDRVLIRHGVRIHWPWKLTVSSDVWIGVDAWLLNLEPITIGSNVCISQQVMLCTGSHRATDSAFEFDNAPIDIASGAWIAARATVLRGVKIGRNSIVGAMALVTQDVPDGATLLAPRGRLSTTAESEK